MSNTTETTEELANAALVNKEDAKPTAPTRPTMKTEPVDLEEAKKMMEAAKAKVPSPPIKAMDLEIDVSGMSIADITHAVRERLAISMIYNTEKYNDMTCRDFRELLSKTIIRVLTSMTDNSSVNHVINKIMKEGDLL